MNMHYNNKIHITDIPYFHIILKQLLLPGSFSINWFVVNSSLTGICIDPIISFAVRIVILYEKVVKWWLNMHAYEKYRRNDSASHCSFSMPLHACRETFFLFDSRRVC